MNKPRFTLCPGDPECRHSGWEECWRANHIPYVGLLKSRYGTFNAVYEIVFKRYMRMKKFAWPDEVKHFNSLYKAKHPELFRGNELKRSMNIRSDMGCVYVNKGNGFLIRAFGLGGIFDDKPYTPKEEHKERDFLRLTAKKMIKDVKTGRINSLYDGLC